MFKRIDRVIVLLITIFFVGWLLGHWQAFLSTPIVNGKQAVIYDFKKGSNIRTLSSDLKKLGLLQHPFFFELLARIKGDATRLQAGQYQIEPGTKPGEFLDQLVKGKVLLHKITLVEGWTFSDIIEEIKKNPELEHTVKGLTDNEIMKKLGYPEQHPEGRFYPDTYRFPRGTTDVVILSKAYEAMQKRLKENWEKRSAGLPYKTPYEALIVASLVEKETRLPEERPLISGVIVRRLKKGMLLQIDASIIYGLNRDFNGKLTKRDLLKNTPYNSYINKGLPPTPIAMPGADALEAAMNPDDSDYLYFVAKGDGSHVFSATLPQHEKAVKNYRKVQRKNSKQKK